MEEDRRFAVQELRDELRLFCYRISGSLQDAEVLVEASLPGAGGTPQPSGHAESTRTELFETATRQCLEALAGRPPHVLPRLANPPGDPRLPPAEPGEGDFWLEPFPDDLYRQTASSNKRLYGERESVSLYFVAAMQSLRPSERLCFILGDVMGWRVESLAEALGTGVVDTQRILEEGRGSMSLVYNRDLGRREPPPGDKTAELLMRYLYPWETGDARGLTERLSADAVLQLPPSPSWYEGRGAVVEHLASGPLAGEARGRWRLLPRRANGQLAFGVYRRDDDRHAFRAHSIQVLYFAGELVSEIVAFSCPWLFPYFRLLPEVDVQG